MLLINANWQVHLFSSRPGSPEQPFGGLMLLGVFELTVTVLVKIIEATLLEKIILCSLIGHFL